MNKDILQSPWFNQKGSSMNTKSAPSLPPSIPADKMPKFIRIKEYGDKVFYVENGVAHWVMNPDVLKALGGDFGKVVEVDKNSYMNLDRTGEAISVETAKKYVIDEEFYGKGEVEVALEEEKKQEFKTYEDAVPPILENVVVQNAPGKEPVKGFTSIIIPAYMLNYQLFHQTGHCIGSVQEHTDKTKTPYEIILVLNGKTGIAFNKPEDTMADKVIQIDENVGYAAAVNKGIRVAKGEYIVILSNDVLVFDHWLEDLQFDLESKDLSMGCPMYGRPYARATTANHFRKLALEGRPVPISYERDFSLVATRKKLFDEVGLMDEDFYLYKEDVDLFHRLDEVGKKYGLCRSVNTWHCIGMTTVNMSPEEQKAEQSQKHYEEKYGKSTV